MAHTPYFIFDGGYTYFELHRKSTWWHINFGLNLEMYKLASNQLEEQFHLNFQTEISHNQLLVT